MDTPMSATHTTSASVGLRPSGGWSRGLRTGLALAATVVLLSAAAPTTASDASPASGRASVTVHRAGPVKYSLTSVSAETGAQLDEGTMQVRYTCTPSRSAEEVARLDATVLHAAAIFSSSGDYVPCDGRQHAVVVTLDRGVDMPFKPSTKWADAQLQTRFSFSCSECDPLQTEPSQVRMHFSGWPGLR